MTVYFFSDKKKKRAMTPDHSTRTKWLLIAKWEGSFFVVGSIPILSLEEKFLEVLSGLTN